MSVFRPLIHGGAHGDDVRQIPAYIEVLAPKDEDKIVNLGQAAAVKCLGGVLRHPLRGQVSLPDTIRGVQYHPARDRWVVLYRSEKPGRMPTVTAESVLKKSQIDVSRRTIRLRDHGQVGLELRFSPKSVEFIDVQDMVTTNLLTMGPDGSALACSAPIKAAYWDLIDAGALSQPKRDADAEIVVGLFGGVTISLQYGPPSQGNRLALSEGLLELWPAIQDDNWRLYWLAAHFSSAPAGSKAVPLLAQEYARTAATETLSVLRLPEESEAVGPTSTVDVTGSQTKRLMLKGKVRACGIQAGGCAGVFMFELASVRRTDAEGTVNMAIDFGTSRSTVVVTSGEAKSSVEFPRRSTRIGGWGDLSWDTYVTPVPGLGSYAAQMPSGGRPLRDDVVSDTAHMILESALLRRRPFVSSPVPFVDYSIRPNDISHVQFDPDTYLVETADQQELKWDHNKQGDRVHFLSCLLLLGAVEAAARFGTAALQVKYSYPLAFDDAAKKGLHQSYADAIKGVNQYLGGSLLSLADNAVSESLAGLAAVKEAGGDWVLSVDIGGGTTDFGLWRDASDKPATIAAESVEYAGALLHSKAAALYQSHPAAVNSILKGEFAGVLGKALGAGKAAAPAYLKALNTWSGWMVEYIARLVAGAVVTNDIEGGVLEVRTVPLGGGWNAYDVLTKNQTAGSFAISGKTGHIGTLRTKIETRVNELLADVLGGKRPKVEFHEFTATALREGNEKLAVATGMLRALGPSHADSMSGIKAPNGLDESHRSGIVPWTAMVGSDEVFAMDSHLGTTPVLPEARRILADLKSPGSQMSNDLRYQLNAATANQAGPGMNGYHRRRTALSILYREVLGPSLKERK